MGKFVNHKKRAITLPGGAKNLGDLLKPKPHFLPSNYAIVAGSGAEGPPTKSRDWDVTGKLTDLPERLLPVFDSRALGFLLFLGPSATPHDVIVDRMDDGQMSSMINVQMGTARDHATRQFFARHGLQVPEDTGIPASFNPNLPIEVLYDLLPMPADAMSLGKVLADFFREVDGLTDESELTFHYTEITPAA